MTTFLCIVLAVLIAVNVWLMFYSAKREKQRRKLLQERMDEYSNTVELLDAEKRRLEHLLAEKTSLVAHLKKLITNRDDEIFMLNEKINKLMGDPHAEPQDPVNGGEPSVNTQPGDPANKPLKPVNLAALDLQELKQAYEMATSELKVAKKGLKENRHVLFISKECVPKDVTMAEFQKWWNTEGFKSIDWPSGWPLETRAFKPFKDLQDLKQSYDELAKSYDFVSRQYENPNKRYIINNLVRLYDVKNLGLLAKALGVSTSSLSQKIKK